jgi:hypothetical protein
MHYEEHSYGNFLVLTPDEQRRQYAYNLYMILENTRFMLDNLEHFPTYKCQFLDYHTGNGQPRWKKNPIYKEVVDFNLDYTHFNATGWLYNGDCRPVDVSGNKKVYK